MDKPIVIITTIYPFKNGKRPITVGAGPEGELTSLRSGVFADWQALERQAYGELLAAASKPAPTHRGPSAQGKAKKAAKPARAAHRPVGSAGKPEAQETGPIGPAAEAEQPANGEARNLGLLPEIEGDADAADVPTADETQLELILEGSDG